MTTIKLKRLPHGHDLPLPAYATPGAAGMDICAAEAFTLDGYSAQRVVPTGFAVEIPDGWEIQVRPRSGLASKGITVVNTPGTIDSDYRGEIKVLLINHSEDRHHFARGDRIAQLVPKRVEQVQVAEADELSDTARGAGGFGSTGLGAVKGWQPIVTAPKDGTWVLTLVNGFVPDVCFWNGAWCTDENIDPATVYYEPTHWMPLPPPPAIEVRARNDHHL